MMLRFSFDMAEEADAVENAVSEILTQGWRCADIMPENGAEECRKIGCREMGDRIAARVLNGG